MKIKSNVIIVVLSLFFIVIVKAQFAPAQLNHLPHVKHANTSLLSGDTLYVAGAQTLEVSALTRGSKVNLSNGRPDFSFAMPNHAVHVAIADGHGGWFLGGEFTQVGGQERMGLAQLDASGQLTTWNPGVGNGSNVVAIGALALSADGNTLYIGGDFTTLGGVNISRLGAVSTLTGQVDHTFNFVTATNMVSALAVKSNTLYAAVSAGHFETTRSSSIAHSGLISIDLNNKTVLHSYGTFDNTTQINALALHKSTLFVGGSFTSFMGESRNRLASISLCDDVLTSWNPNLDNELNALAISNNVLYAGGSFTSVVENSAYKYLAAFDLNENGSLQYTFNPQLDAQITKLAVNDGKLYAFAHQTLTTVNAEPRNNASFAIDLDNNSLTDWEVKSVGYIGTASPFQALAFSNNALYAGGRFSELLFAPDNGLIALKLSTGDLIDDFEVGELNTGAAYNVLTIVGNTLYVGGTGVTTVGGVSRGNLVAFNRNEGTLMAFNPLVSSKINSMVANDYILYIGGEFTTVGSPAISRRRLASFDLSNGTLTSWDPNANGTINTLALYRSGTTNMLYAGGTFTTIGSAITRNRLAAFDLTSNGALASWNPNAGATVYAIALLGDTVYVGGNLTSFDGVTRNRIAAFEAVSGSILSWNPNANQWISFFAANQSHLFAGGRFTVIAGQTANYLAAFERNVSGVASMPENWTTGITTQSAVVYHALSANDKYLSIVVDGTPVVYDLENSLEANRTLPVTLTSFSAKAEGKNVKLEWQTTKELNNEKFLIYRKGQEGNFTVIGDKQAHGNTTIQQKYMFYDRSPLNETNYYKLMQKDIDGNLKELAIQSLTFDFSDADLQVLQNPIKDGKLLLRFSPAKAGAKVIIVGIDGKVLVTQQAGVGNTGAAIAIHKLNRGVYVVSYLNSGQKTSKRFIIP